MERVVSHRQLKHGTVIIVKDGDGNEIPSLSGHIVGFPYSSSHRHSANGAPDMVLIRLKSNKDQDTPLSRLGLGPHADSKRRAYIVD